MDQRSDPPQSDNPMLAPRYSEIATFMRAPLRRDPAGVDIGLVGVPFDGAPGLWGRRRQMVQIA